MGEAIVTNDLTKVYTEGPVEVKAVSSVDLRVSEGEVVGLFGPSGSGKTTLLSLLGCILNPSSGRVSLYGEDVSSLSEEQLPRIRKKYVSFIFQGYNLFPALTAYENVMLMLKLKGATGTEADTRAKKVFSEVGMTDRMHFLPRDLSGGQKQRVAVARALVADSPIILADEPTGNLDYENGRNVMEILKRLSTEHKKCVIVATHDNRIEDVLDRVLTMEDGKIIKDQRRVS